VTLKGAEQSRIAAAAKAERDRDKAQALLDYEAERLASRANMARLRTLRLAGERADSQVTKARPKAGKRSVS
jgi:hypothetical protein